jgi:hypothetical protein
MKNPLQSNRTGMLTEPKLAAEMLEIIRLTEPSSGDDDPSLDDLRGELIAQADSIGSRPQARKPSRAVLLDKLGDRLAFERTGTRLYDAVIAKAVRSGSFSGGPDEDELRHIRDEEFEHVTLVSHIIRDLGGDPTMVTPCADISMVASSGLISVVSDPRTSVAQCLQAILIAELADNDEWELLVSVADAAGEDELVDSLREAREEEAEHLDMVRGWVKAYAAVGIEKPGPAGASRSARRKRRQR